VVQKQFVVQNVVQRQFISQKVQRVVARPTVVKQRSVTKVR
jgi:hypothetical protein